MAAFPTTFSLSIQPTQLPSPTTSSIFEVCQTIMVTMIASFVFICPCLLSPDDAHSWGLLCLLAPALFSSHAQTFWIQNSKISCLFCYGFCSMTATVEPPLTTLLPLETICQPPKSIFWVEKRLPHCFVASLDHSSSKTRNFKFFGMYFVEQQPPCFPFDATTASPNHSLPTYIHQWCCLECTYFVFAIFDFSNMKWMIYFLSVNQINYHTLFSTSSNFQMIYYKY